MDEQNSPKNKKVISSYNSSDLNAPKNRLKNLKKLAVGLLVIGLIALAFAAGLFSITKTSKQPVSNCPDDLLRQARLNLDPTKVSNLEPVVNNIRQLPKYKESPDCMYVVTKYFINISDGKSADESLNQLRHVYNAETGYSSILGTNTEAPDSLQPVIDFLKQLDEQAKKGFNASGGPL